MRALTSIEISAKSIAGFVFYSNLIVFLQEWSQQVIGTGNIASIFLRCYFDQALRYRSCNAIGCTAMTPGIRKLLRRFEFASARII